MKTKNLILILIVLGLIAIVGGFILGSFNKDDSLNAEKTNNTIEETDKEVENGSESETVNDDVSKPDADKEDSKEDVLEEETYEDEKDPALFIEEGLVAYYPFNEDIKDYSGKEIDATNHNAYFVEGKYDKALKFNGKNSYVHALVDINPIPMPQMTMSAWVKSEDSEGIRKVICHDNSGYDRCMGADNRNGEGWSCFAGDGKILGYSPITINKWTFIAAVYDQTAGTVKLFVDGLTYEKKGKIVGGGNDFILIGANGSTKLQREYFMGAIDEVRIYDYALSNKELNSLYKTGVARPETEL